MTYLNSQLKGELKILAVFGYGNIFNPKAGNESRIFHIIRGLEKKNKIITLEREEFKENKTNLKIVDKRYFFNDLNFKNIHFGVFFSDLNPYYYLKINEIIRIENPDIIQISYPRGLIATKICLWLNKKNTLLVYEAHDLQTEVSRINANDSFNPFLKRNIINIYDKVIERIAVKIANHVTTVSEIDKKKFIKAYSLSPQKVTCIPSAIEIRKVESVENKAEYRKKFRISNDKIVIVFHGVYHYLPNKEAVHYIENFIAPELTKIYDNIVFAIAGKGLTKQKKDNIFYFGFVESLYEFLSAADIAIVPVMKGGGTRIKILDYMCTGLPIISTKKGIEGIDAKDHEDAIIVDSVNYEFIDAVKSLIEDKNLRERIGFNARKLAEEKYDFSKVGNDLTDLYLELLKMDNYRTNYDKLLS